MSNIDLETKFKKLQADSAKRSSKFYEANKQKISDRRKELKALKKAGIVAPPKVKPEQVQQIQPEPVQQIQPKPVKKPTIDKNNIITIEDIEASLSNKTPTTRKNYISHIKNIKNKFFKNDDYTYIKTNSEALVKAINESINYKNLSKKTFMTALHAMSRSLKLPTEDIYYKEMMRYKKIDEAKAGENQVSDKKLENYDTIDNLKLILKKMKEDTFIEIRDKLMIALYVLRPPLRNDYEGVRILKKETSDKINYIIKSCSSYIFYLNNYKTTSTYGEIVLIFSKDKDPLIFKLIGKLSKFKPAYLLTTEDGAPLSDKQISARIPYLFEKYLNKHINISMIRSIYETELMQSPDYAKLSHKDKQAKHDELQHSASTASLYYNKVNLQQF
jgi:hypothetical protein